MPVKRLLASALICVGVVAAAAPAAAATPHVAPHSAAPTPLEHARSGEQGAAWLASRLTPGGYLPSQTTPGQADIVATANTVLALASAGDLTTANRVLVYLEGHVDQYVVTSGADGPGQLSLLILDAHALGVDPHSFGGTDLVARLLATQRTSGPDAGLFGAQDPTFDGAYRQGLSLSALAAEAHSELAKRSDPTASSAKLPPRIRYAPP